MRVRVTRAYGPWSKGHIFPDMQPNEARTLIARGLVEPVEAVLASPVDRMMRVGVDLMTKRGSGRPRKEPTAAIDR